MLGRGCRRNCESEPAVGCLWINRLYLSCPPLPIPLLWSLSNINTPPSFTQHTHTNTRPQGCQGDGNVILNYCHLCWVPVKQERKTVILKINTRISVYTEKWKDRSRENAANWKETKSPGYVVSQVQTILRWHNNVGSLFSKKNSQINALTNNIQFPVDLLAKATFMDGFVVIYSVQHTIQLGINIVRASCFFILPVTGVESHTIGCL